MEARRSILFSAGMSDIAPTYVPSRAGVGHVCLIPAGAGWPWRPAMLRGVPWWELHTQERSKAMSKLQNKVAVITGGSSGIGLATAQRFVKEGAFVYIFGRRQRELEGAAVLV